MEGSRSSDRIAFIFLAAGFVLVISHYWPADQKPNDHTAPVKWTAADRDVMIRTVIGETWHPNPARRQPRLGARAVAWVIVNRTRDGRFGGKTIRQVCLAKWQFEPWATRRKELLRITERHPAWRWAAAVVDPILQGQDVDPTNGALFFLNPVTVRKRRKHGDLPRWAVGKTLTVSADNAALTHVFYTGPKVAGWFRTIDDLLETGSQPGGGGESRNGNDS